MTATLTEKREARKVVSDDASRAIENLLIRGDLGALSPEQRNQYYMRLCEATGLNPLTQPFEYLRLNGKLVLYAKKACTDQLRALHKISVVDMDQEEVEGVYSVTVKVQDGNGRSDMDIGAVNIAGLKGEARGNAMMKASTKAKRRATLSICGLGLLDETEIETIPTTALSTAEEPPTINPETGRKIDPKSAYQQRKNGSWEGFEAKIHSYLKANDLAGLEQFWADADTQAKIDQWNEEWQRRAAEKYEQVQEMILQAGAP